MPTILVFPNLAKCFCWRETQARFERTTLPSQVRLHHEEKILNDYIAQNGIEITCEDASSQAISDDCSETEREENFRKGIYRPHRRLGIGFLNFFRTMRYLALISCIFALVMMFVGFTYMQTSQE